MSSACSGATRGRCCATAIRSEIIERLLKEREPIYAEADIHVESEDGPHGAQVDRIITALEERGIVEAA